MNFRILRGYFYCLLGLCLLTGCSYFQNSEEKKVVVRVNESYLYEEDINALINENTSEEDSALIVSNYINRWATQKLLIDRARLNLPQSKLKEFNDLVENYRNELYTSAYTSAVVTPKLDTSITNEKLENYFKDHKDNFKLGESLIKLRYISLEKDNSNLDEIKERIERFNEEDKAALNELSLQFKNYSLNDSVWVKLQTVYDKIKPLTAADRSNLLKKSNFLEVKDSLSVYLIFINDVLERGQESPLEYAKPTIKKILLNKQKLNLIKELEKDITKDAIKKEQFEIYN